MGVEFRPTNGWCRAPWLPVCLALCALAGLLLTGCGASPQGVVSAGNKAFQTAAPELKADWTIAAAAAQTNGYSVALTTAYKLLAVPGISAEQTKALRDFYETVSDKMFEAANKGDADAKLAVEEIRKLRGH